MPATFVAPKCEVTCTWAHRVAMTRKGGQGHTCEGCLCPLQRCAVECRPCGLGVDVSGGHGTHLHPPSRPLPEHGPEPCPRKGGGRGRRGRGMSVIPWALCSLRGWTRACLHKGVGSRGGGHGPMAGHQGVLVIPYLSHLRAGSRGACSACRRPLCTARAVHWWGGPAVWFLTGTAAMYHPSTAFSADVKVFEYWECVRESAAVSQHLCIGLCARCLLLMAHAYWAVRGGVWQMMVVGSQHRVANDRIAASLWQGFVGASHRCPHLQSPQPPSQGAGSCILLIHKTTELGLMHGLIRSRSDMYDYYCTHY